MALIPSSNQILWIRPRMETLKGAVMEFPDVDQPPDPENWFSIAYDPNQGYWIARHAYQVAREFMGAVTGAATMKGPDLHLFAADSGAPSLMLTNYKYVTQLVARHYGNAFRGTRKGNLGATLYCERTRYVREVEYAFLTPQDKLGEMSDYALRDPNFAKKMSVEFSHLAHPVVLLSICAVMGVFLVAVAGAAALGGAAFAATFARFAGIALMAPQILEYKDLFLTLDRCLKSNEQSDFSKGASTIQKILICMLRDISFALGLAAAGKAGAQASGLLKELFVKFTPQRWKQVAEEIAIAAKQKAAVAGARWGYAREDLLRKADITKYFRKGEENVFLRRAKNQGEMIVIREPSNDRLAVLKGTSGWADGKPEWIKAKSSTGKFGIVGFKATDEAVAVIEAGRPSRPYPTGNLKGISEELDAIIAKNPNLPSWEVPYGKTFKEPEKGMMVFDWDAAGANHCLAKGARCVKLGDRYLIVDALGRPICQDLDIGAIAKQGQKVGGEHLSPSELRQQMAEEGRTGKARNKPEDDFYAEEVMNYQIFQDTGQGANMIKHGGLGGSNRHIAEGVKANTEHWSPLKKDGTYDKEKLIVFLPIKQPTGMSAACFEFAGYADLEAFCKANNFPFNFNQLSQKTQAARAGH
jgi:hypothetical protein